MLCIVQRVRWYLPKICLSMHEGVSAGSYTLKFQDNFVLLNVMNQEKWTEREEACNE